MEYLSFILMLVVGVVFVVCIVPSYRTSKSMSVEVNMIFSKYLSETLMNDLDYSHVGWGHAWGYSTQDNSIMVYIDCTGHEIHDHIINYYLSIIDDHINTHPSWYYLLFPGNRVAMHLDNKTELT